MSIQTAPSLYFSGLNFNNKFYQVDTTTVGYVADSDLVHTVNDETITGNKTFTGTTTLNGIVNITKDILLNYTPPSATSSTYKGYHYIASGSGVTVNTNQYTNLHVMNFPAGIWAVKYSQQLNYTGSTTGTVSNNTFGYYTTTLLPPFNERTVTVYQYTKTYSPASPFTVYTGSCLLELTAPTTMYYLSVSTTTGTFTIDWVATYTRIA